MITSKQNSHILELAKLHQKKFRDEQGLFLVEGSHLVEEAFKQGVLLEVLSIEETKYPNTTLVMEHVLEKLSQVKKSQGIIGVCKKKQQNQSDDSVLVLELNDPGNLGTLIRSAVGFGFQTIYYVGDSVDPWNDKVLRATQGAIFHVKIEQQTEENLLELLKEHTWLAADMYGESALNRPAGKIALFLGQETHGVSPFVKQHAKLVSIETIIVESLNVGVAGSILMHALKKPF